MDCFHTSCEPYQISHTPKLSQTTFSSKLNAELGKSVSPQPNRLGSAPKVFETCPRKVSCISISISPYTYITIQDECLRESITFLCENILLDIRAQEKAVLSCCGRQRRGNVMHDKSRALCANAIKYIL